MVCDGCSFTYTPIDSEKHIIKKENYCPNCNFQNSFIKKRSVIFYIFLTLNIIIELTIRKSLNFIRYNVKKGNEISSSLDY